MTDKTNEALKLAEEALNAMLTHMGMDEDEWTKPTFNQAREALATIREALAEPVKPQKERQDFIDGYTAGMADAKRMQANAEPVKQEPVAWATKISKAFFNSPANGVFQVSHLMRDEYSVPLYTTPPSVGAARIADSESWMQVIDAEVANAIEATKEKAAKVFHEQAELFQIDYYVAQTIVEVIRSMK